MHEVSTITKKVVKEIPVYYGGETGPDLEYCAELENTTTGQTGYPEKACLWSPQEDGSCSL